MTHSCVIFTCLIVFVIDLDDWLIWRCLHLWVRDKSSWFIDVVISTYGVATISRLLKIIGLFCKRDLQKRRYSAKETYNFIDPTDCSHPIMNVLILLCCDIYNQSSNLSKISFLNRKETYKTDDILQKRHTIWWIYWFFDVVLSTMSHQICHELNELCRVTLCRVIFRHLRVREIYWTEFVTFTLCIPWHPCVTWLMRICDVTHSYVTCLIHAIREI